MPSITWILPPSQRTGNHFILYCICPFCINCNFKNSNLNPGDMRSYRSRIWQISGIHYPGFQFILILALLSFSCDPGHKISDLTIDNSNALQVRIEFKTSPIPDPIIRYWKNSKPEEVYEKELSGYMKLEVILYRLSPNTSYGFQIIEGSEESVWQSDTMYFETPRLPLTLPKLNIMVDSGDVFEGYLMVRHVADPSYQILINDQGDIVWYHPLDTLVSRFYSWTDDKTILSLHSENEIIEFDLSGETVNTMKYGENGFDQYLHHEIIQNHSNQVVSLTRNMKLFDLTEFGGTANDTIFGDGILVLDKEGNKVWEWDIYQHEDPLLDENINEMKKDWSHANSLEIDSDGHYLISFRNFHQIWKIHSLTGDIIWKMGMNGDFDLSEDEIFYSQHAAYINIFGELMIFDNGGPERMYSRAISFNIRAKGEYDPGRVWITLPREFYSFKEGSAYLIGDDKVLFCSSRTNNLIITDLEGHILWQLHSTESFYRAFYIEDIPAF